MTTINQVSLYPLALSDAPQNTTTSVVPTLLAISHSLENTVLHFGLHTRFYAGFQRLSAFLPQLNRFARLAARCGTVLVFAYPDVTVPTIPGVQVVPLAADAPLVDEWFIVVQHPDFSAALLTREMAAPTHTLRFGRGRSYEGVLSFRLEVVRAAQRLLAEALGETVPSGITGTLFSPTSPHGYFNQTLMRYQEQRNQELASLYQTLSQRNAELERLQKIVSTLVSQAAWQQAHEQAPVTNVQTAQLTILMTDIEGFTRLSERVPPAELVAALNRYWDYLTGAIYREQGDVDKFLGDGMLAFFADPAAAWRAAQHIQQLADVFNLQQTLKQASRFPTRIGLASGPCLMGSVGSQARREVTVIGDAVNLASRLQALAQPEGIMLDAATHQVLPQGLALAREVAIRGKAEPQTVYEVAPERLRHYLATREVL